VAVVSKSLGSLFISADGFPCLSELLQEIISVNTKSDARIIFFIEPELGALLLQLAFHAGEGLRR
jgi:hypothetical protein